MKVFDGIIPRFCFCFFLWPHNASSYHMACASCIINAYTHRQKTPDCTTHHVPASAVLIWIEDDVRMWQSRLYSPVCFITGVTQRQKVCETFGRRVFALSAQPCIWLQIDRKQAWGWTIVISLVQLCQLLPTYMHKHTTFAPLPSITLALRISSRTVEGWGGCVF